MRTLPSGQPGRRPNPSRPPTLLRNRDVVGTGPAEHGIDGAHYRRAYYPRTRRPAIVIATSALGEEIVNFPSLPASGAWLAARLDAGTAPLPTSVTGPASRTAREEELLAFLIREPARAVRLTEAAGPATFTTHLRAIARTSHGLVPGRRGASRRSGKGRRH
jgi:hypothetical protein